MTDIFGSNVQYGGAWVLDGAVISLKNGDDLIVNSCAITYNRPVNKIVPLNTNKQYLIAGRGMGSVQLGMIVGPSKGIKSFIEEYADACKVSENTLTISALGGNTCDEGEKLEFICSFCLLSGISVQVTAGDLAVLGAGMTLVVGGLELK